MTTLQELPRRELAERLSGVGLALQCGPLAMRLGSSLPELVHPLALLYGEFLVLPGDEFADFHVRVEPVARWRRPFRAAAAAVVDGREVFEPFVRKQALAMFEWAANWCLFSVPNGYLLLHSAVVERDGRAMIISGQPGAGKSTLAAALMFTGWRLFSDEIGMIRPGSRMLLPVPRPVGLKNESIDIVRRHAPEAILGPETFETRKGTVSHLRPRRDDVLRAGEGAPAAWVVFPRFVTGASLEVRALSRPETLLRLGHESFNYSMLGISAFDTLVDVVSRCQCFELRYGNLDDALAGVGHITASLPPA